MTELGISMAELVVSIAGGGGLVTLFWTWRADRLEQYRYLDKAYCALLEMYFDNPRFGDPSLTKHYATTFEGEELVRYHYFAMRVHTFLETLDDVYGRRILKNIEWGSIFRHHSLLHWTWLDANRRAHTTRYVARVSTFPEHAQVATHPAASAAA